MEDSKPNTERKLTKEELSAKLRSKLNAQSFSRLPKTTKEEQLEIAKAKISEMMKNNKPAN